MKPFFFRYVIQDRQLPRTGAAPRVVVIVDQHEASARQRLLRMHPNVLVMKVDQTPFDADCTPAPHMSLKTG